MTKRSYLINAPDGKRTRVNKKAFELRESADKFKKFIGRRFHEMRYDDNSEKWIIGYYRDTKRNREMFGFDRIWH